MPRYTEAQTRELQELHAAGASPEDLALYFEVSERSMLAKLSSLGLYQKRPYLNKRGQPPKTKAEYLEELATLLETTSEQIQSLEKANKQVLQRLINYLK